MSKKSLIRESFPLGYQWPTLDPFLFCVHHVDHYPIGTTTLGPEKNHLKGRNIGQDFESKDGFRMYHGERVPGFPVHPHRGFETITIVRRGYVDHADSMGAAGRYGEGDLQWMTAGNGVQHSEMFPLLHQDQENPVELFQIWLNLPQAKKRANPYFKMFWSEQIPIWKSADQKSQITLIAGALFDQKGLTPPPDSWAAPVENDIGIFLVHLEPHTQTILPRAQNKSERLLYFYQGKDLTISGESVKSQTGHHLVAEEELKLESGSQAIDVLVLQARPIGEPVVQYGPFVMNTREEINQTLQEFRRTEFGGWPWRQDDMTHGSEIQRFAQYPDGRIEKPTRATT